MSQTMMVVGLGRFGQQVARTLAKRGVEVIAIDGDLRAVEEVKDEVAHAASLDATSEAALRALPLDTVDAAVVAIGEDLEANIFITALLKKVGIPRIIARASTDLHARILSEIGAAKVVFVEVQMGEALAETLALEGAHERVELSTGHIFAEISPPRRMVGQSLRALNLRASHGLNVIAILQHVPIVDDEGERAYGKRVIEPPDPDYLIAETDTLAVIAMPERLRSFLVSS
jgi:trk system potassium uptake protein TrkA